MYDDDLYDGYSEKFDDCDWQLLVPDMIEYFKFNQYAIDSFKEWWVEQQVKNHTSGNDDYLSDQAWNDFNQ